MRNNVEVYWSKNFSRKNKEEKITLGVYSFDQLPRDLLGFMGLDGRRIMLDLTGLRTGRKIKTIGVAVEGIITPTEVEISRKRAKGAMTLGTNARIVVAFDSPVGVTKPLYRVE